MNRTRNIALYGFFAASLVTFVISIALLALVSARLNQVESITSALAAMPEITPTAVPSTTAAQWSVLNPDNPAQNLVSVYALSTNWDHQGAPSLRFYDTDINRPGPDRSFEIGFYRYGPSWYSPHYITEFWLGDGHGGTLSIAGNNQGGGDLQVRNSTDTGSIQLDYRNANHPMMWTEGTDPLYFRSPKGLISENHHSFMEGISITGSDYSGQVIDGAWDGGKITVTTSAVRDDSFVEIMPVSESVGRWWVCGIVANQSFTVCSTSTDETMNFHWLVIGGS